VPNGQIGLLTLPQVWARILEEAGTTTEVYTDLVCHVLDTYNTVTDPTQRRTIIHDNLTSHSLAEVFKAVRLRQHRVVCHPPYWPQDGPVEFAINQVCRWLEKRWSEVDDL
jgi:hypothetical protein